MNLRRAHLLALSDDLAHLKGNLGVVDNERGLFWAEMSASYSRVFPICDFERTAEFSRDVDVLSINAMSFPVRPPILPRVPVTPLAKPAMAGPALLVTRDRPSEALAWYSFALPAVSLAASAAFCVVVLSNRRKATRRSAGERRAGRAAVNILRDCCRSRPTIKRAIIQEKCRISMDERTVGGRWREDAELKVRDERKKPLGPSSGELRTCSRTGHFALNRKWFNIQPHLKLSLDHSFLTLRMVT